jgi:hypothetical protein
MGLKEEGKKLNVTKNGSSIPRMSFSDNGHRIMFTDICSMLSPGTSLNSFAALTKLKQTKMVFPFSAFTSRAFLDNHSLPTDDESWFDTLSGEYISPESRQRAFVDFGELGCATIGDYLNHYLRLDVVLLGRSIARFFATLYSQFGTHPVDNGKLTIASYSFTRVQKELFYDKRPGASFSSCYFFVYPAFFFLP